MRFASLFNFRTDKNYKDNLQLNSLILKNIVKDKNTIIVIGEIKSTKTSDIWIPKILFEDKKIIHSSNVRIDCTCPSFKYEFANILYKRNELIEMEKYKYLKNEQLKKIPQVKACKHIIQLSNLILRDINKINRI